ncbi:MAG: helix-turn-helix transcriptional regulator [Dysgonomonas sp.]
MQITVGLFNILFYHFNDIGMSEKEVLSYLKLDPKILNNTTNTIDADIVGLYLELVTEKKNNRRIGLETGFMLPFTITGSIFNHHHNCNTVREVFEDPVLLSIVNNTISEYTDRIENNLLYHEISVNPIFAQKYPVATKQWYDMQYGICLQLAHSYTGKNLYPMVAHSVYAKEDDKLEEYLNCPVLYSQDKLAMVFPESVLDLPIKTSNKSLLPIFEDFISEIERDTQYKKLSDVVSKYISEHISTINPSLKLVAKNFNMSERSLQRRLKDEGTSYQLILDRLRIDLSQKYLNSNIPFSEIAFLLGFESQSAFNKFFKKHFDCSPSQY